MSRAAAIEALIRELAELKLDPKATDTEVNRYRARVEAISVQIGAQRDASTVAAHALQAEQQGDKPDPFDPRWLLLHIAGGKPVGTPAEDLAKDYREYVRALGLIDATVSAPPAPPQPPAPPVQAPAELSDEQATWYLDQLRAEFVRHGWPATIEGARGHWRQFGRPQGRKWAAEAPPPAWGPRAEDAPPGVRL